ncbi:hypothetical protein RB195_001296 [Necator americanus]|uniref:Uncharacterized protein n=1 Tax=Necator americanus TaxID=51031 RepID=A0ABR1DDM0_NECAM
MRPVLNWIDKVPEDEGHEGGLVKTTRCCINSGDQTSSVELALVIEEGHLLASPSSATVEWAMVPPRCTG